MSTTRTEEYCFNDKDRGYPSVPDNIQVFSMGKGTQKRHYITGENGSMIFVMKAVNARHNFSTRKVKYCINDKDRGYPSVPDNVQVFSMGKGTHKRHYIIGENDKEISVIKTDYAQYKSRKPRKKISTERAASHKSRKPRKKNSTKRAASRIEKYCFNDRDKGYPPVPEEAQVFSKGKGRLRRHYIIDKNNTELPVITAEYAQLKLSRKPQKSHSVKHHFFYAKYDPVLPGTEVLHSANYRQHYALKDGKEVPVYTKSTINRRYNSLKRKREDEDFGPEKRSIADHPTTPEKSLEVDTDSFPPDDVKESNSQDDFDTNQFLKLDDWPLPTPPQDDCPPTTSPQQDAYRKLLNNGSLIFQTSPNETSESHSFLAKSLGKIKPQNP